MSYRNGDKSREHRIRKARQKKRDTVRQMKSQSADQTKGARPANK